MVSGASTRAVGGAFATDGEPSGSLHAAIMGATNATLQLVFAFGYQVTYDQNAAITSALNAWLVIASMVIFSRWRYRRR